MKHKEKLLAYEIQNSMGKFMTPIKSATRDRFIELRSLLHANLISKNMNPNMIESVFHDNSVLRSIELLNEANISFATKSTISSDMDCASNLITNAIKKLLKDDPISLIADGATLKNSKAIAVLIGSPALPFPILAHVIHPENIVRDEADSNGDEYTYNFVTAGSNLLKVLNLWDISIDRVVQLMGDNVVHNKAIARVLGVRQGHCKAHAYNLVIKNGVKYFQLYQKLVIKGSAIISVGGSTKRSSEITDYAMNVKQLKYYPNRFGSIVACGNYRLQVFDQFSKWLENGTTLPVDDIPDFDDNFGEPIATTVSIVKSAYKDPMAKLALAVCDVLYGDIPALITKCSTDNCENLDIEQLYQQEVSVKNALQLGTTNNGAQMVVSEAYRKVYPNTTPSALINTMNHMFCTSIKNACVAGLTAYMNHIECDQQMHLLKRRFDVKYSPPKDIDENDLNREYFLGTNVPELSSINKINIFKLVSQYKAYVTEYHSSYNNLNGINKIATNTNYGYWNCKRNIWPELSHVALWWACVFLSSIGAERTFGIARIVDSPQRGRLGWDTFSEDLKFRVNSWLINDLLEDKLNKIK